MATRSHARGRPAGRCVAGFVLVCAVLGFVSSEGARSEPAPKPVVIHYLPFPAGVTYKTYQGNDQKPSHHDKWNRYAFDFSPMPQSAPVCATADGTVVYVKEDTSGPTGRAADNNEVAIRHADGTVGTYHHLEKDGATVEVGDVVYAGDVIGRAGNTGKSTARHLHFNLKAGRRLGPSIPCRFADVPGSGVPETGDVVKSGNVSGRRLNEAILAIESLYDDASAMNAREAVAGSWKTLRARPPRTVSRALETLGRRDDFVKLWERRRDALLARHEGEATAMRDRIASLTEGEDLAEAVYLATIGKKEFGDLKMAKEFSAALKALRENEGFREAQKTVRASLRLRDAVVRAVERDLEYRAKAARGKRVRWKTVLFLYDKALKEARAAGAEDVAKRLARSREAVAQR